MRVPRVGFLLEQNLSPGMRSKPCASRVHTRTRKDKIIIFERLFSRESSQCTRDEWSAKRMVSLRYPVTYMQV